MADAATMIWRSKWARLAMLAVLTLILLIPLLLIADARSDRARYSAIATNRIVADWGGSQVIDGPYLVVPVERRAQRDKTPEGWSVGREKTDAGPQSLLAWIAPKRLTARADLPTEIRSRGIFSAPVYKAAVEIAFDLDATALDARLDEDMTPRWDDAFLSLRIANTQGLRGEITLAVGEDEPSVEPGATPYGAGGLHARLGDPRGLTNGTISFELNGAQRLGLVPAGRQSSVSIASSWPHPSFDGAFSPTERRISDEGFSASWSIPALARAIPNVAITPTDAAPPQTAEFGVKLYRPVDIYQKIERATKYGVLFIALTFLTVFLLESAGGRPAHAAHYLLIGLAQCVFFLLLLAFAEHMGFTPAYALASAATIALITAFAARGLGPWKARRAARRLADNIVRGAVSHPQKRRLRLARRRPTRLRSRRGAPCSPRGTSTGARRRLRSRQEKGAPRTPSPRRAASRRCASHPGGMRCARIRTLLRPPHKARPAPPPLSK